MSKNYDNDESPCDSLQKHNHKWRPWHEREIPVKIDGNITASGFEVDIKSRHLSTKLQLDYPDSLWLTYPKENRVKLVDNLTYLFTAHFPFLLKGNIRLEYNTGHPHVFSWANHCFMRYLPAYWYLQGKKRGTRFSPMLKTLINSTAVFSRTKDFPPKFPATDDNNVIIPFTFGKDSFLTYHICKELGLKPILVFFEDPIDYGYEGKHKKLLFEKFKNKITDRVFYIENPLGSLREQGEGWFGWELAITSWILLSLPIAYKYKTGYVIISNEKSVNNFFYDDYGLKVATDFEQSEQAIEELTLLTQALSEGEVYTTTFLQGIHDLGILAILKDLYYENTYKYLMSCWAEKKEGKDKRWCGICTKCARLYIYLLANGIDPIKEAGFEDNMLIRSKKDLYNVFEHKASGTGWDAFGVNRDEQALSFHLAYLRGCREDLVVQYTKTQLFKKTEKRFEELVGEYFGLHPEKTMPLQWKKKIEKIFSNSLARARKEIINLPR